MRVPLIKKAAIALGVAFVSIKKAAIVLAIVSAAALGGFLTGHFYPSSAFTSNEPAIFYSLDKRANDQAIIDVVNGAQRYIYFAVYVFTKSNIADALVAAKQRGIDVRGITDAGEAVTAYEKPVIQELAAAGIAVETQKHADGLMHIKAIVTDKAYAMGSYNWTESATVANDELLEVGTDDRLRGEYADIIKNILTVNRGSDGAPDTRNGTENNRQNAARGGAPGATGAGGGKVYPYFDAAAHIGETATVRGAPVDIYISTGGMVFFDYCKDYKNCPFSAVIFASDAPKFENVSQYQGKEIDITGAIKSYGGKVEIVISDPGQIAVSGS